MGVGVIEFRCATLSLVVSVFSVLGFSWFLCSSASFGSWAVDAGLRLCFRCPGHIEEKGTKEKDEGDYYRAGVLRFIHFSYLSASYLILSSALTLSYL